MYIRQKTQPKTLLYMNRSLKFSQIKNRIGSANKTLLMLVFIGLLSCGGEEESNERKTEVDDRLEESIALIDSLEESTLKSLPQVEIPDGYMIISEDEGDLDGDGINEKVVVFDTDREVAQGKERELRIYFNQDGVWSLSHKAIGPVLPSQSGGTMGDPFEKMTVTGGGIIVNHFGGSVERWSYTHEFRLIDDEWKLAIATLVYFSNCDFTETYTYNLVKLNGYHSRQKERCDENGNVTKSKFEVEESLTIKKASVLMDGFGPGSTEIEVKGEEDYYYL